MGQYGRPPLATAGLLVAFWYWLTWVARQNPESRETAVAAAAAAAVKIYSSLNQSNKDMQQELHRT